MVDRYNLGCSDKIAGAKVGQRIERTIKIVRGTNARKGDALLKAHGDQTNTIDLSFVPSVEIDNHFSYESDWRIIYNLDDEICKRYRKKFNETLTDCDLNK